MNMSETFPRVVGRYLLFDAIASGGMASVHLGRLIGAVGFSRTVAIKRLHEALARDPELVAMFLDEARIVTRIHHPNVVPTLDVVAAPHEVLLVMEYVVGESLSSLLKQSRAKEEPSPVPVIVDIMASVLCGLHAAHEATDERGQPLSIVHRDVSPQNILVGADGIARVLDFGIAKAVGRTQETRTGQVKGKARYMAPEQITGGGVDRAADVYAASVVLWEALSGVRLFTGENDPQIMYRVVEGRVPALRNLRPDITPELEAVVMRGLQLDPSARYPTAKAMADALEESVEPVTRSVVADWVGRHAAGSIERQKATILAIESEATAIHLQAPPSSSRMPEPRAAEGPGSASAEPAGVVTETARDKIVKHHSVITAAGSLSTTLAPAPQGSDRVRNIGIAALLASAALVVFALSHGRAQRSVAAAADEPRAPSVTVREDMPRPIQAPFPSGSASSSATARAVTPFDLPKATEPTSNGTSADGTSRQRPAPIKKPGAGKSQSSWDRIYKRD